MAVENRQMPRGKGTGTLWSNVLLALLPGVSFFVFPAFSFYFKSTSDFMFGPGSVTLFSLAGLVLFLGLTALIARLLPQGKARAVYGAVLFSIGLCLYVQYNFLNPRFGVLDGTPIDWSKFTVQNWISLLAWVACIAAAVTLALLFQQRFLRICRYVSAFLVAIEVVTVLTLAVTTPPQKLTDFNVTTRGMLDVSDENIVVFVLDSLDEFIYQDLRATAPELTDEALTDFVSFNNCISGGGPTQYGLPLLLTGQPYADVYQPYNDYLTQAYQNCRLYEDLRQQGYRIGLYTPNTYLHGAPDEWIENTETGRQTFTSPVKFAGCLYKFCAFFTLPQPLKQSVWGFTDQLNRLVTLAGQEEIMYHWSTENDQQFYQRLRADGLSYKAGEKNYRFYHMVGAHAMDLNENMEMDANSTYEQETRGEFMLIETYIRQLKELGVYDNTTIVITADHGIRYEEVYAHPMVLVKPKGHTGPYEESSAPIQFMQFPATVASQFLTDHSQYGPSYFEVDENSQPDRYQVVHPSIPKYAGILEDDDPDGKAVMFVFHGNVADNQFELVTTAESGKN